MENKTIAKIMKVGSLITFLILLFLQLYMLMNVSNYEGGMQEVFTTSNLLSRLSSVLIQGLYCSFVFGIGVLIDISDTEKRILSHLLIPEIEKNKESKKTE